MKMPLESLKYRREELCINFAKKCLKNEKNKDIFPIRSKKHEMETIDEEKYVVYHANTERMKKSSIPYMQRLLNQYEDGNKMEQHSVKVRRPG